jgi:hypothetical protein
MQNLRAMRTAEQKQNEKLRPAQWEKDFEYAYVVLQNTSTEHNTLRRMQKLCLRRTTSGLDFL